MIDIGRDDTHRVASPSVAKSAVPEGTTCFVMQPFGGHLGTYYESIFKPAIQQAGLVPVRADDDIFATGKIMDQVWRGIRQAKVLVAELTSKNPNVFYELGLAHALEKPVIRSWCLPTKRTSRSTYATSEPSSTINRIHSGARS